MTLHKIKLSGYFHNVQTRRNGLARAMNMLHCAQASLHVFQAHTCTTTEMMGVSHSQHKFK